MANEQQQMSSEEIRRYAAMGVEFDCQQALNHLQRAYTHFPELRKKHLKFLKNGINGQPSEATPVDAAGTGETVTRRKRAPMTRAQKKALGERMKVYWANKRAAKAAGMGKRKQGRPKKQPANVQAGA